MRFILSYSLLLIIFFITPVSVFADSQPVVINEFSANTSGSGDDQDWIELYNTTDDNIDLSTYILKDLADHEKNLEGSIPAHGFVVFDWGNVLNKDKEVIFLLNNGEEVGKFSYDESDQVMPGKGQSMGRREDNGNDWVIFSSPSKGTSNNSATIYFTPTPTPLNTPIPTKIPTPTKTPSPTRVPTLTRNPTTSDPNNSLLSKEPTGKVLAESDEEEASDPAILDGIATVSSELLTPTDEVQPTIGLKTLGVVRNTTSGVIIIIGSLFFFAACGILLWKKYR